MLVLSRKNKQRVVIGDEVEVVVVSVHSSRVKLGIIAPSHVSVRRGELQRRILSGQRNAAAGIDGESAAEADNRQHRGERHVTAFERCRLTSTASRH